MSEKPVQAKTDFDIPSVTKSEGYITVDHRNSPGLTEEQARKMGYENDLHMLREGKVFEAATLACVHCPSVFIKNPERMRSRGFCPKCNGYICDACEIATKDPNYIHYSKQEFLDKMTSGKWSMTGSMSLPIFTRKDSNDG